ncbi:hypothetical protein [Neisseria meningitidis]|uniref:hypothetical protein n=1 Tax=Neisseria meningitidis TaxID=487 RepID=UPI0018955687|nr:hypothetical protein [Neisseria meningitidis]
MNIGKMIYSGLMCQKKLVSVMTLRGAATGNFSYPIFYIPIDDKPIDPDKKISFFDSPYTPSYTAAFVQGFGVKERNGDTEEQAKQFIDKFRTRLKKLLHSLR